MTMSDAFVGIDVVDLGDPRTQSRHLDVRFVERVLARPERLALSRAASPNAELWGMWAAKEAAYKVASKLRGTPPVFVHAAFTVSWDGHEREGRMGWVSYEELRVPVRGWWSAAHVHVVAASAAAGHVPDGRVAPAGSASLEELLPRLSAREADAVHSGASAAVRIEARGALASALAVDGSRLQIVCDPGVTGRRPPRVLLDDAPAPADVSLSHHGAWLAWAVLVRTAADGS